jgi:DNA-binding transcriptional ArsR family regulator
MAGMVKTEKLSPSGKSLTPSDARRLAMSHPTRRRLLRHYVEHGPMAPVEVANDLDLNLTNVSYHSRTLCKLGVIELVKTEPRRGSTKHYYRAIDRHLVDESEWENLDVAERDGVLGDVMQPGIDDFSAASRAGTLGQDGRFHITREPIRSIDQEGYDELLALHMRTFEETHEIISRAVGRMKESGEEPVAVSSGQTCFIVPGF